MIKIFGKKRYHWQPELSWAMIYWSLTLLPLLIALIMIYEKLKASQTVVTFIVLTIVLIVLGLHRYFIIDEDGSLSIISVSLITPKRMQISSIKKIQITKHSITLITDKKADGYTFYMRKWPKKYFLDEIGIHPEFKGEVELLDNFIKLDYFEHYQKKTKAPI